MACPDGQYFCNDRQKCMPIPKGKRVRKDGELVSEVAPPGWGHTKAEKEKTDPSKPQSKIGGSAAAFDRARKEGRFKGSKADMFKLMWWMKNKGGKPKGKPHYKPGTDKKYKKYQEEQSLHELNRKEFKKLNKAGVGRMSDNPKEQDKARLAQAEVDLRDLMRQRKSGKVGVGKSMRTEELTFEGWKDAARSAIKRVSGKKSAPKHD